ADAGLMRFARVCLALAAPAIALAQSVPGPELLGPLVGTWAREGESVESPFSPKQTFTGRITAEWFGRFAVVRRADNQGSVAGERHSLQVLSYDASSHAYSWYGVDDKGVSGTSNAEIAPGPPWTLTSTWSASGKGRSYKIRGTLTAVRPDTFTWLEEYS